jgi:hypothetical protein
MSNRVFTKSVSILFMTENIVHKSKDETTSERQKRSQAHLAVKELEGQTFSLVDEQSSTHSLQ